MNNAKWLLAIAPAAVFFAGVAKAQGDPQPADLRGSVIDAKGAVVPGADVVIFRDGLSIAHVRTNDQGEFSFAAEAREYGVIVHVLGFQELRTGPVPFRPGSLSRFTVGVASAESSGTAIVVGPVQQETAKRPWEYGLIAQGGVGTSDRSGFKFLMLGGHAGKVLTPNLGSGVAQGNFEYAVEVFPLWQSYTPKFERNNCTSPSPGDLVCSPFYTTGGTYTGVSVTPIMLRWNFTHGQRWMPWVQGAGGVVWTNHKYPAIQGNVPNSETSVWNFTPQFGVGTHYFLKARRSLDISANAVHISSASLGDKNPGVNASVQFSVGYTWWK